MNVLTWIAGGAFAVRYWLWKCVFAVRGGTLGRGVRIFPGVRISGSRQRPVNIGDNVTLMPGVIVTSSQTGRITLGKNVYVGEYSVLASNGELTIEDDVLIAQHNNFVDFDHDFRDAAKTIREQGVIAGTIRVGRGAWIGCNCCILKNVSIGPGAVVGAGSVVTGDVEAGAVAAGNPARVIKKR